MRSEMRGVDRGAGLAGDREAKPLYNEAGQRNYPADEAQRSEMASTDGAVDRSRTAEPYQPRPSVGERVRSFFSGREPSGY